MPHDVSYTTCMRRLLVGRRIRSLILMLTSPMYVLGAMPFGWNPGRCGEPFSVNLTCSTVHVDGTDVWTLDSNLGLEICWELHRFIESHHWAPTILMLGNHPAFLAAHRLCGLLGQITDSQDTAQHTVQEPWSPAPGRRQRYLRGKTSAPASHHLEDQ